LNIGIYLLAKLTMSLLFSR